MAFEPNVCRGLRLLSTIPSLATVALRIKRTRLDDSPFAGLHQIEYDSGKKPAGFPADGRWVKWELQLTSDGYELIQFDEGDPKEVAGIGFVHACCARDRLRWRLLVRFQWGREISNA